jgi:hypothetical protein
VELFKKKDSRFYWHDCQIARQAISKIYQRDQQEESRKLAGKIAALRLSQAIEGGGLLDRKAPRMQEFSIRFLIWVESAALADKSKAYYGNGWRLLSTDEDRQHAPGSHNKGRCRSAELQWLSIER